MKETLISGKFLFSQTCCTVHTPDHKAPASGSESKIGTIVIIITGPTTKTASTGVTWKHSKEVIAGHLGSCQGSHEDPLEVQYCNSYGTWFRRSTYLYRFRYPGCCSFSFALSHRERPPAKILRRKINRRARSRRKCATSRITFRKPWRWK